MFKPSLLLASSLLAFSVATHASEPTLSATLYKDPYCGCCTAYAEYLEEQGFAVKQIIRNDMPRVKQMLRTHNAQSCHTVKIGNYVVEGHVPVAAIHKMLDEQPEIHGIALPGMPLNSPGMGPEKPGSLEVLSLDKQGQVTGLYQRL